MSLLRLLKAGKCFVGLEDGAPRYQETKLRLLPTFGSGKNPFRASAVPEKPEAVRSAPTEVEQIRSAIARLEEHGRSTLSQGGPLPREATQLCITDFEGPEVAPAPIVESATPAVPGPNGTQRLPAATAAPTSSAAPKTPAEPSLVRKLVLQSRVLATALKGRVAPLAAGLAFLNPRGGKLRANAAPAARELGRRLLGGVQAFFRRFKAGFGRFFLWFASRPKPAPAAVRKFQKPAVQAELSLDHVKVVRNDLSDADVELIPAGTVPKPPVPAVSTPRKPAETVHLPAVSQSSPRPMWERVSLQMFGAAKE